MSRSVLRVADQAANRIPDVCVLSGVTTEHAVRVTATEWDGARWLLGVPGFVWLVGLLPRRGRIRVALPMSERVWRMWQRRRSASVVITALGLGLAAAGTARGTVPLIVVGVLTVLSGAAYRTTAVHDYWVTCRLRPATETIIVEPTHPLFDQAAKAIFIRSL